ncbi:MAG: hypothetical protein Athens101428_155 [Candidatus Berkelbacteria bacterium Athens1014_28]|uniref:Uncharacterized protein n=1 Tax=Candidatus Berkelbacteria bacterium Athens1014_28 TaxID=2017145 RepID=A0A554LPV0_9BACT|nr:MAG: hypothetical protein Athens101428_155 [Candidatus Berkelbacteria bacterium Athens1014_28]
MSSILRIDQYQYEPFILLSAGKKPVEFPGKYLLVSPSGNGLKICDVVGDTFSQHQHLIGKQYSSLSQESRWEHNWYVIIDTTDLNPSIAVKAVKYILPDREHRTIWRNIVFMSNDFGDSMFDPVANAIDEELSEYKYPPNFFEIWPSMPQCLFSFIFGFRHPDYTDEEILRDAKSEMIKASSALTTGKIDQAQMKLSTTQALLDLIRNPNIALENQG